MAQWGEYQSLFQLSVALNTALAAVSDFLGSAPREGADRAERLADRARQFQQIDDPRYKDSYTHIVAGFTLAKGRYQAIYENYELYVQKYARPVCIAFALMSFAGLLRSSINYTHGIEGLWLIFAYLQFVPIMAGAVFALYRSLISLREPNRRLRECSRQLEKRENEFNQRRQGDGR